jgi:hypothetical protein
MPRRSVSLLVVAFLCRAALGEEATASETKFLRALTEGLVDQSPEVRRAAAEALVVMGRKAAAHLVGKIHQLSEPAVDAAVEVLVRIGEASLEEIDRLPPTRAAHEALERVRKALEGEGGVGGFGAPDPGVQQEVRAIIGRMPTNHFTSGDPALREIQALGRPAIPVLLDYLNPAHGNVGGMRDTIAQEVLGLLCRDKDVARLCRLLDLGWLKVAAVLAKIGSRDCVPALIRVLDRGQLSWDVARALQTLDDARADKPIVRFLEKCGAEFPYGTRTLLEIVARRRLEEALPTLRRMRDFARRDEGNAAGNEVELGRTLVLLGDASGIPLLIRNLNPRGRRDEWSARNAGETLNAVTGLSIWRVGIDGTEATAAYRDWWEANGDKLEWDAAMRRFRVRD